MNINDAVSFLSAEAKKCTTAFDVIAGHSKSEGVSVFQGKVQNTEISESVGIGVRVFNGEKPGYAYTEHLAEDSIRQTLKDALSHTAFTKAIPIELPRPSEYRKLRMPYNEELSKVTLAQMADLSLEIEKKAFALSSKIENIPYLGAGKEESIVVFENSNGVHFENRRNGISAGAGVLAVSGESKKLGAYDKSGLSFSLLSADEIASKAVSRALELLSPSKIDSGKMPVVFSERVAGSLVAMYASSFYAEQVQKGQSRLQGKLGAQIADKCFSLSSDPFREDLPGVKTIDSEGVVAKQINLVQNGKLEDFLYNLETAQIDKRTSNGSAARSYSGKVGTSFSNLIVAPGSQKTEELLKLFPKCFFVVHLDGNSGCSAISGEMSIGAQGLYVENGKIMHPVEGVTLSANFFDLLQSLVAVGNEYPDAYTSIQVPALAFPEIALSN